MRTAESAVREATAPIADIIAISITAVVMVRLWKEPEQEKQKSQPETNRPKRKAAKTESV